MLPDRIRLSVWSRFYRGKNPRWNPLYHDAALRYAPGARMELVPGDVISDSLAFTGVYELAMTRRVVELASAGGTFIDVGANLGYFALLWAAARPDNRCLAFEASPRNIEILRRNIRRNGFESQIEVIPHAAGKSPGKFHFDPGPAEQTGWGGLTFEVAADGVEVDVVRIDDMVSAEHTVALLKVDIEGADSWALMGSQRLLEARSVQEIWFEQNKPRIRALGLAEDAAQDYLQSLGYSLQAMSDASSELVEWSAIPNGRDRPPDAVKTTPSEGCACDNRSARR